jgi:hypothetical protein
VSRETARKLSKRRQGEPKPAWGWRIVGLLLGLAITLAGAGAVIVNGVQGVQATGLVGTRGTFTVDHCYKASNGKWPDYKCRGTFAPRAAESADRRGTLENAEDFPAGKKLDVVEGSVGSERNFRETGVGTTLGSVMWMCCGLVFLPWGFLTTRKWAKSFKK